MSALLRLPWGDYITASDIKSICVIEFSGEWRVNVEMNAGSMSVGRVHVGSASCRAEAEGWRDGIAEVRDRPAMKGVA
jgi:hypothetical protein